MVRKAINTYNVKYSISEPLMEYVRGSEDDYMDGYIYINGEKKDFRCMFYGKLHLGQNRIYFEELGSEKNYLKLILNLKETL